MNNIATVEFCMPIVKPGIPLRKAINVAICSYLIGLPEYREWLISHHAGAQNRAIISNDKTQATMQSFFTDDVWQIYSHDTQSNPIRKNPKLRRIIADFNSDIKSLIQGIPYFFFWHDIMLKHTVMETIPENTNRNNPAFWYIIHYNHKFYYLRIHATDMLPPPEVMMQGIVEKGMTNHVSQVKQDLIFDDSMSIAFKISLDTISNAEALSEYIGSGNDNYTMWYCDLGYRHLKYAVLDMNLTQKKNCLSQILVFYYELCQSLHYIQDPDRQIDFLVKVHKSDTNVWIKTYGMPELAMGEPKNMDAFNKNIWYSVYHVFGFWILTNPNNDYDVANQSITTESDIDNILRSYGVMCRYIFQNLKDENNGFDYLMAWFVNNMIGQLEVTMARIQRLQAVLNEPAQSGGFYALGHNTSSSLHHSRLLYRKYKCKYLALKSSIRDKKLNLNSHSIAYPF